MKSFILNIVYFLMFCLLVSYPISYFIKDRLHTNSKHDWILDMKGVHFDYAVLGSSRAIHSINTQVIDNHLQTKGINLATSGSNFADNFVLLSLFLEENRVKQLILNVDEFCFNSKISYSYPFHEYEFITKSDHSSAETTFYDYIPEWKYYLWKIIPLSKYIEYGIKYSLESAPHIHEFDETGGYIPNENNESQFTAVYQELGFDSLDNKYFHRILDLCKSKDIEVIMVATPEYCKIDDFKKNREISYDYIAKTAKKEELRYVEMMKNFDTCNNEYFADFTHLNDKGALHYSELLAEKLKTILK